LDHLASAAGGNRRIPFLAGGHDREQLAQQSGGDGGVGLSTVELVVRAARICLIGNEVGVLYALCITAGTLAFGVLVAGATPPIADD
jgi:hypothetical protein